MQVLLLEHRNAFSPRSLPPQDWLSDTFWALKKQNYHKIGICGQPWDSSSQVYKHKTNKNNNKDKNTCTTHSTFFYSLWLE